MVALIADRGPFADQGGAELVFPGNGATRVDHIGEYGRRADKDIILAGEAGKKGDIVLDLYPTAQQHFFTHHHILADGAILARWSCRAPIWEKCQIFDLH